MDPGALTHLDRIIIAFAVVGSVLFVLLPVIIVLLVRDGPPGPSDRGPSR